MPKDAIFISKEMEQYFEEIKKSLVLPFDIDEQQEKLADSILLGIVAQLLTTDITKQFHKFVRETKQYIDEKNIGQFFYSFEDIKDLVIRIHSDKNILEEEKKGLYNELTKFFYDRALQLSITPHPTSPHTYLIDETIYKIYGSKTKEEQIGHIKTLYTDPKIMERQSLTVEQEVDKLRWMLNRWFKSCSQLGENAYNCLQELYKVTGNEIFNIPRHECQPVELCTWIASDTDGNSNVNVEGLEYLFTKLREDRYKDYLRYLEKLRDNSYDLVFGVRVNEIIEKYKEDYEIFCKNQEKSAAAKLQQELLTLLENERKEILDDRGMSSVDNPEYEKYFANSGIQFSSVRSSASSVGGFFSDPKRGVKTESSSASPYFLSRISSVDEVFRKSVEVKESLKEPHLTCRERIERLLYRTEQIGDYGVRVDLRYNRADIEEIFKELFENNIDVIPKALKNEGIKYKDINEEILNELFFLIREVGIEGFLNLEFKNENSLRLFDHMRKAAELGVVNKVIMAEVSEVTDMLKLYILAELAEISNDAALVTLVESNDLFFGKDAKQDEKEKIEDEEEKIEEEEKENSLDTVYANIFLYTFKLLQQNAVLYWNDSNELAFLWGHSDSRRQNGVAGGTAMLAEAKKAFLSAIEVFNDIQGLKDNIAHNMKIRQGDEDIRSKVDEEKEQIKISKVININELTRQRINMDIEKYINEITDFALKNKTEFVESIMSVVPKIVKGVNFEGGGNSDARKTSGMSSSVSSGHLKAEKEKLIGSLSNKILYTVQGHDPLLKIFANYLTTVLEMENIVAAKAVAICSKYIARENAEKKESENAKSELIADTLTDIFKGIAAESIDDYQKIIKSNEVEDILSWLPAIAAGVKLGNVSSRATARKKQPGPINLDKYRAISTDMIGRLFGFPRITFLSAPRAVMQIIKECEKRGIKFADFPQDKKEEFFKYERLLAEIDFSVAKEFFPENTQIIKECEKRGIKFADFPQDKKEEFFKYERLLAEIDFLVAEEFFPENTQAQRIIKDCEEIFSDMAKNMLFFMHNDKLRSDKDFAKKSERSIMQSGLSITNPSRLTLMQQFRDLCKSDIKELAELNLQMIREERWEFTDEEAQKFYPMIVKIVDSVNNIPHLSPLGRMQESFPALYNLFISKYMSEMHSLSWHGEGLEREGLYRQAS